MVLLARFSSQTQFLRASFHPVCGARCPALRCTYLGRPPAAALSPATSRTLVPPATSAQEGQRLAQFSHCFMALSLKTGVQTLSQKRGREIFPYSSCTHHIPSLPSPFLPLPLYPLSPTLPLNLAAHLATSMYLAPLSTNHTPPSPSLSPPQSRLLTWQSSCTRWGHLPRQDLPGGSERGKAAKCASQGAGKQHVKGYHSTHV